MPNVIAPDFVPTLYTVELFSHGWRLEVKEVYAHDRRQARRKLSEIMRDDPAISTGILYVGKIGIGTRKSLDMLTRAQIDMTSTDMFA